MFYTCIINYIIEHNWTAFNIKLTIYFLGALLIPFIQTRPGTDEADLLDRIGTPPATWSACFHSHRPRPKQVARIAWQEAREVTNTNTQRPERMCMTYLKIFASENDIGWATNFRRLVFGLSHCRCCAGLARAGAEKPSAKPRVCCSNDVRIQPMMIGR